MKTWFKFYGAEFIADPKMDALTAIERALWTTLMCLASMSDEEGVIRYSSAEKIMRKTNLTDNEMLSNRYFLDKFRKLKMIEVDNENGEIVITLVNFTKRNAPLSDYERLKSYRERKKLEKQPQLITKSYQNDNDKNRIEQNRYIKHDPKLTASPSRIKNPDEDTQDFEVRRRRELDKLSKSDEAVLAEGSSPEMVAKAERILPVKLIVALFAFLALSFSPVEARTVQVQPKFNRPTYQFSGTALPKASKKVPEQKNTAGERPVVARTVIKNKILEKFGKDGPVALAVARCESGLRPGAIGDGHIAFMKDGVEYGKSYGVFQIRALPGRPSPDRLLDANYNIEYAYQLYKRSGFGPWSAYTNGCYLNFLAKGL